MTHPISDWLREFADYLDTVPATAIEKSVTITEDGAPFGIDVYADHVPPIREGQDFDIHIRINPGRINE
jgi:hypothetical protein